MEATTISFLIYFNFFKSHIRFSSLVAETLKCLTATYMTTCLSASRRKHAVIIQQLYVRDLDIFFVFPSLEERRV